LNVCATKPFKAQLAEITKKEKKIIFVKRKKKEEKGSNSYHPAN